MAIGTMAERRDGCQVCSGECGGVPGNENVIGGVVMCDYCHAALLDVERNERETAVAAGDLRAIKRLVYAVMAMRFRATAL